MEELITWIKVIDTTPEAIVAMGVLVLIGLILHGIFS